MGVPVLTWPQQRMASRVTASLLYATTCLTSMSGIADPTQVDAFSIDEHALYRRHHRPHAAHPPPSATATNHDRPMDDVTVIEHANDTDEDVLPTKMPLPAGVMDFRVIPTAPFGRLTVASKQHYLDMAVFFAHDHTSRLRWRRCLETSRWYSPLFDSTAMARSLEHAYLQMWNTWTTSRSIRDVMVAPRLSNALVTTSPNADATAADAQGVAHTEYLAAITSTPHALMTVTSAVIGTASGLPPARASDRNFELPSAYPLLTAWAEQELSQIAVAMRTFVLFSAVGRDLQHPDVACFPFADLGDVLRHCLSHLYQFRGCAGDGDVDCEGGLW